MTNMHTQGGATSGSDRLNAGIDVAKEHLDACLGHEKLRVSNDAPGWDELIAKLKDSDVDLVVVEPTGGYERGLVCVLHQAGIAMARVNPRQARDFAKSMGDAGQDRRSRCQVPARLRRRAGPSQGAQQVHQPAC